VLKFDRRESSGATAPEALGGGESPAKTRSYQSLKTVDKGDDSMPIRECRSGDRVKSAGDALELGPRAWARLPILPRDMAVVVVRCEANEQTEGLEK
jgi:hypothetical protein